MRKSTPNLDQPDHSEVIKTSSDQSNFILKAFQIISSVSNHEIIHWSKTGYSFIIESIDRFQQQILPKYFRHNRYQSFVRQLNMYDFHKVRNGDYYCQNKSEFKHEEFYRSNYPNILNIKRKGFKAKPPGKENHKKGYKDYNTKRIKKSRKPKIVSHMKLSKKQEEAEIYEEIEKHSEEDQVSMELQIENTDNVIGQIIQTVDKFDPVPIVAEITEELLKLYREKQITKIFSLNFNRKFHWHIELAEKIKQKWNIRSGNTKNDSQYMKQIYNKVKQAIESQQKPQKQQIKQVKQQQMGQFPNLQSLQQLISIEQEEDMIIDSIFKKEIRSTLISINSQTFLNHQQLHRKNDLLMNL